MQTAAQATSGGAEQGGAGQEGPVQESAVQGPVTLSSDTPSDSFLANQVIAGDAAALRALMGRYDRLVRFAILETARSRCVADPQWLDSVASESWEGLVRGLKRIGESPRSVKAYLLRITHNRCVSAMRRSAGVPAEELDASLSEPASSEPSPDAVAERVELLDALRGCLADLGPDDQKLSDCLELITQRQWKAAGELLGVTESTLRSRWKRVLERLRGCIANKTGISLAPGEGEGD